MILRFDPPKVWGWSRRVFMETNSKQCELPLRRLLKCLSLLYQKYVFFFLKKMLLSMVFLCLFSFIFPGPQCPRGRAFRWPRRRGAFHGARWNACFWRAFDWALDRALGRAFHGLGFSTSHLAYLGFMVRLVSTMQLAGSSFLVPNLCEMLKIVWCFKLPRWRSPPEATQRQRLVHTDED